MTKKLALQMADLLEAMLPKLKEPPQRGYRARQMELVINDVCDAGGIEVDGLIFDPEDAETLLAALREYGAKR